MATRKSIRSTASTAASRKKANQAIKANSTKPVVAKATSSKFAGPSLPGKVQPGYYDYSNKAKVEQDAIINKKNNSKSSNNSSKSSSNKSKNATAAKVQGNSVFNTVNSMAGINTAEASNEPKQEFLVNRPQTKSGWERAFEIVSDPFGMQPRARAMNAGLGFGDKIYETEGQDSGGVIGNTDELLNAGIPQETVDEIIQKYPQNPVQRNPYSPYKSNVKETTIKNDSNDKKNEDDMNDEENAILRSGTNGPVYGDTESRNYIDEIQNPEPIQNNITSPPPQQAGMPGSGQSLGAGKYSNGALLKNNPAEDNYIKQLRKAYSGDGGMKELRNQFEELIKQLDPTYDALQKEGTEALNANLIQNSNQLASVMNAGNVGDSEQRTQQLAGLQNNNTTALGNLLAKLAQGKASDVSNYRSQLQGKLSDAQQRNQSNQQRLMEAINSYRNQQEEKQGSLTNSQRNYGTKSTKVSHNDIFNFVNDSLSNGSSWAEIAEGAKSQGVDTSTGSYLDQLLNQANKQNRWA